MSNEREIPEKYIDLEYQLLYETKINQQKNTCTYNAS